MYMFLVGFINTIGIICRNCIIKLYKENILEYELDSCIILKDWAKTDWSFAFLWSINVLIS